MKTKQLCEEIVSVLVKDGYLHQVRQKDLEEAIMKTRQCIDERTNMRWLRALLTFGYIVQEAPQVYKLNPIKIPELMALLKKQEQTKLQ